jgi:hypothetical protein
MEWREVVKWVISFVLVNTALIVGFWYTWNNGVNHLSVFTNEISVYDTLCVVVFIALFDAMKRV